MGASFTNCQIRSEKADLCREAAAAIVSASCVITDSQNGWVSLYDEKSESQDLNELQRVAKALSSKLATQVLAILLHDSDMFVYVFYEKGKLVDQFNSRPDCFGPVSAAERKKWAGNVKKLMPLALKKSSLAAIEKALGKKHLFEEERVRDFARLVGIDEERACAGFKYIQEGDHGFPVTYGKAHSPEAAALVAAVEKRDLEKVRALLAKKVSPNIQDRFGYSLLVSAVRLQRTEIALALLEAGADPFFGDHGDAVWAAASHGNREVLGKLLQNRSERLAKSLPAALNNGVMMGHAEIVEDLLQAGADPNLKDAAGRTPLMAACSRGTQLIWEVFAGQKFPTRPGEKPTDWAAMVNALLKAGADVNLQDSNGMTALMMARSAGQAQIVERLLQAGANAGLKPDSEKLEHLMKALKAGQALPAGTCGLDSKFSEVMRKLIHQQQQKKKRDQ